MTPSRTLSVSRSWVPARRSLLYAGLALALLLLAGCDQTGQMVDQARYEAYEASEFFADGMSARQPVPGTEPYRGEQSPNDVQLTGLDASDQPVGANPLTIDTALVAEGQERYAIFCTPCHGATGEGNGSATTFGFPRPPSLLENTGLSDGELFDIITNGRGQMFPYGYRVKAGERWAVIAYIRAMQLRGGAVDPQELTPDELNRLGAQP